MIHKLKRLIQLLKKKKFKELYIFGRRRIWEFTLRIIFRILPHRGINVVSEDWKYLIVLDACRYDTFKKINNIPGKLERKISKGSHTIEWLKNNFSGYYEDIIYISSHPFISKYENYGYKGSEHFSKIDNVWDYGWDKKLNTVPPREVSKAAMRMIRKYPHKRVIIHYMQPHAPWIGKSRVNIKINRGDTGKLWNMIRLGKINIKKVKECYEENLKLVIKEVKDLIKKLDGKIVITADHGECFGENFIFEHPYGIHVKELVTVPWLIVDKNSKKVKE